jgi:hypothetical protein
MMPGWRDFMQALQWPRWRGGLWALLFVGVAAGGCGQRSADAPPADAVGLRTVAERDGEWLEHPGAGFRFRHPGPDYQLESALHASLGEQAFLLRNARARSSLFVEVMGASGMADTAALRGFRALLGRGPTAAGQRNGVDSEDLIDGRTPVLQVRGYMAGVPMVARAIVIQASPTERHVVGLVAVGPRPEELAAVLDSLRPTAPAAAARRAGP